MTSQRLDIRPLKQFAAERLPHQSALREILLQENNEVSPAELVSKLWTWLLLLRRIERGAAE